MKIGSITITLDLTTENIKRVEALLHNEGLSETAIKAQAAGVNVKSAEKEVQPAPQAPVEFEPREIVNKRGAVTSAESEVKPEPKPEPENEPRKSDAPKSNVTLTDVRAVALKLSRSNKKSVLKDALAKFGANKLSDVKESDYPALLAELTGGVE